MYSPFNFAMDAYSGVTYCDDSCKEELNNYFDTLYNKFVLNGYRVVIGEMAATKKKNERARNQWATYFVSNARLRGLGCVVWDNQHWGNGYETESFGLLHKNNLW